MYNSRLHLRYYCRDWPGARSILYPDQIERWGWSYHRLYSSMSLGGQTQLFININPDPSSEYHFLLNYQYTQSMKETILSLPARVHVPGTGKNTFQIPYYDLYPTLDVVGENSQYHIIVHKDVEEFYKKVVEEDEEIKDLSTITAEDTPKLRRIREIIDNSKALNPEFKLYNFQYAGVGAMLMIFGVADSMQLGVSRIRRADSLSQFTEEKEQSEFDFSDAISELVNL